MAKGGDGGLEAEPTKVARAYCRRLLHGRSNEVVRDGEHDDLLAYHFGSPAAKALHRHGRLYIAEVELDRPAATVQFGQVARGMLDWIEKSRRNIQNLGTISFRFNENANDSNFKGLGQVLQLRLGESRDRSRTIPCEDPVMLAKSPALAVVDFSSLMHAHDRVGSVSRKQRDVGERAVASVRQDDVALAEEAEHLLEDVAL